MLRNGGDSVAERLRQQGQITDRQRDQQPGQNASASLRKKFRVPTGTNARGFDAKKGKQAVVRGAPSPGTTPPGDGSPRERLLQAAFAVFSEHGFAGATTLEIATRAQVSKRYLYALFYSKQAMLAACMTERAGRMRQPLNLASQVAQSREALEATLVQFSKSILHGLSDPNVLAVYRLAIAESARAPDIARTLDKAGREANHVALGAWLANRGLIGAGNPAAMAAHFLATLGGALLIQLLLRVRDVPTAGEIESRARIASESLILLYPPPRPSN
jgi:AcrR family transcriptional regulator